jgi:hypothetical protein
MNKNNVSINMNMDMLKNFGDSDKTNSNNFQDFDFFQQAVPKDANQGLKIKKLNLNNTDLI